MNAIQLAVRLLFVVIVTNGIALVSAQQLVHLPEQRLRRPEPNENHAVVATAEDSTESGWPYGRLLGASMVPMHNGHSATFQLDQPRSGEPVVHPIPNDGYDELCQALDQDPCPCVYGQVEALFMARVPGLIQQPIVVDPNTNTTFLATSDLGFGFDPGLRATVGTRLCGGRALEISYLGLFQATATAAAVSPGPAAFLIFPDNFFGNVFVGMDLVQVGYLTSLHSVEANLLCCCGCCDECHTDCGECGCTNCHCRSVEWFAGFRRLYLGEELNILAQRTVGGGLEEGTYYIRTANNLYGVQAGARLRRTQGQFGWEATGKGGIFGNSARQEQAVIDFPNFPLRPTVSSSSGTVAFVGEINLSALYHVTDVWNLRAGYSVMWIEGVALAPDQLDFNFAAAPSGDQLNRGGGLFLHGVNVGVEARW